MELSVTSRCDDFEGKYKRSRSSPAELRRVPAFDSPPANGSPGRVPDRAIAIEAHEGRLAEPGFESSLEGDMFRLRSFVRRLAEVGGNGARDGVSREATSDKPGEQKANLERHLCFSSASSRDSVVSSASDKADKNKNICPTVYADCSSWLT